MSPSLSGTTPVMSVVSKRCGSSPAVNQVTCLAGPPTLSRSMILTIRMRSILDIFKMPQFHHQQIPELERMIGAPFQVLVDQPSDLQLAEIPAPERARRKQGIAQQIAQRPSEPLSDRN